MKLYLILTLSLSYFIAFPSTNPWEVLSKLKFEIRFDETLDDIVFVPKPDKAIKKLAGKELVIRGFKATLYTNESIGVPENKILLCRYKEQHWGCCSSLGIESFISIRPKENLGLVEGKPYIFKGTLVVNTKDYLALPYQLKDAECLNCDSDNE